MINQDKIKNEEQKKIMLQEKTTPQEKMMLQVEKLTVNYPIKSFFGKKKSFLAVDEVSFSIKRGETLGIVGESGSGKTTVAMAVARLIDAKSEKIIIDGIDFVGLNQKQLQKSRQKIQIIFQDPYSSLNPRLRASEIIRETLKNSRYKDRKKQDDIIDKIFNNVGLRPEQKRLFPHQFSGGQRQRIGIARALATKPDLVICDEPVSALDVAVQAQILNLLRKMQKQFDLTYLFISHDLGVIQFMCDHIAVMYMGKIVEIAEKQQLFQNTKHPYTKALLAAVPGIEKDCQKQQTQQKYTVSGEVPDLTKAQKGCRFASRCMFAIEKCYHQTPMLKNVSSNNNNNNNYENKLANHKLTNHKVACHLV